MGPRCTHGKFASDLYVLADILMPSNNRRYQDELGPRGRSKEHHVLTADAIRLAYIYKYGGAYMDADFIALRLQAIRSSFLGQYQTAKLRRTDKVEMGAQCLGRFCQIGFDLPPPFLSGDVLAFGTRTGLFEAVQLVGDPEQHGDPGRIPHRQRIHGLRGSPSLRQTRHGQLELTNPRARVWTLQCR